MFQLIKINEQKYSRLITETGTRVQGCTENPIFTPSKYKHSLLIMMKISNIIITKFDPNLS